MTTAVMWQQSDGIAQCERTGREDRPVGTVAGEVPAETAVHVAVVPMTRPLRSVGRQREMRPPNAARHTRVAVCDSAQTPAGYRMGRWSRLAMTGLVAAAIVVGIGALAGHGEQPVERWTTVGPNETVATVVAREMADVDPVSAVTSLRELNGIEGWILPEGAVLRLP